MRGCFLDPDTGFGAFFHIPLRVQPPNAPSSNPSTSTAGPSTSKAAVIPAAAATAVLPRTRPPHALFKRSRDEPEVGLRYASQQFSAGLAVRRVGEAVPSAPVAWVAGRCGGRRGCGMGSRIWLGAAAGLRVDDRGVQLVQRMQRTWCRAIFTCCWREPSRIAGLCFSLHVLLPSKATATGERLLTNSSCN